MATLVTTITETLRYRGKIGQYSWAFHRLSGLGIVLFLILHVIDTSWAAFYPELYGKAIQEYQSPLFTIGEFFLVAAVVYHAMNGLRIIFFDYRPHLWHLQQKAAVGVFAASAIILLPTFIIMLGHTIDFWDRPAEEREVASLMDIIGTQSQFLLGFIVIIGVALAASFVMSLINGDEREARVVPKRPSQVDAWLWSFMRWSGVLIVPLVFGHLAMIHLIGSVFDINHAGAEVVGTTAINESGRAAEFVGRRWDHLVAGVAVWRIYDGLLLALVVIHGFNGLRYVVNDYAHNKIVNRAFNWAIVFGGAALIILGMAALIAGVDETAYRIASDLSNAASATVQNTTSPFGG
ncbi:MAG: succinate dehydrogenase, cytochrome b556 subunit [Phototrophicales bacterium]|nr:MAG: succinate dehydrogenase, cytochrome b556 subunit [Phototrophicales bacterium]